VRRGIGSYHTDPAVRPIRVGPVRLEGDEIEAALADQGPGDVGPQAARLVRAVRRLPNQHEPRLADEVEHASDIARTRTPPLAIAPIASSGCRGTPSLRTTKTSSATPSDLATS